MLQSTNIYSTVNAFHIYAYILHDDLMITQVRLHVCMHFSNTSGALRK